MIIYFDIETVWERISEWELETEFLSKASEKYWERINFMPEFNKIFTITCWTIIKDWEVVIKNLEWSEEDQIKTFFKSIEWNTICWYNIKGFDLPFIIKRALKYQIDIPNCIKMFWKKPREMENIIDLFEVYKNWVFWWVWNLDLVCNFLWITSPKDWNIDWSEVQKYYDEWKKQEILEYCKRDVLATIRVYQYFKEYNLI